MVFFFNVVNDDDFSDKCKGEEWYFDDKFNN